MINKDNKANQFEKIDTSCAGVQTAHSIFISKQLPTNIKKDKKKNNKKK